MHLADFTQISEYIWEIPNTYQEQMRVPVRLFAAPSLLASSLSDNTIKQAINAAALPGLVAPILVMPDMHEGYGFPIGGVGIMDAKDGVISPGGIGYDINCGVRLLASSIHKDEVRNHFDELASSIYQLCPSGVGKTGIVKLKQKDLEELCHTGLTWAKKAGVTEESDLHRSEDGGCLAGADFSKVSKRAVERGITQLGSLGAGNHFIEVGYIEKIYQPQAAQVMGLKQGMITVLIHTGSRGFGHQICTDAVHLFQKAIRKYNISILDRELVCAPIQSPEGEDYLAAMRAAANYAYVNRQFLSHQIRIAFEQVLAGIVKNWHLHLVYDLTHNIAKIETLLIDGKEKQVCVHRKGATRAFPAGAKELPAEYQPIGQPVLVPGSMGTSSWVLISGSKSLEHSYGSSCHGAGRMLSRHQAKKQVKSNELRKDLESQGVHLRVASMAGLAEEAPAAYKDVDVVIDSVCGAEIAEKVASLKPIIVIKG